MDNDKQVTDLVQTTRDRFLNQPINPAEQDKETFDLEKEFAKAAKNRSLLIPLVVAAFLVVLGVGAWVASQFTEQASQKSSVSIGSFEDLKLKEIFDTARKNKKDLETVQDQINQLTIASNARIVALQQAGNSKADIASVNDSTGAEAKAILAETSRQVAAEKASLTAALRPLKTQAEEVQKKIDSYDDRIGQLNRQNQQVLDTQQRLFDLQKQKMIDEYETRIQGMNDESVATVARLKKEREDFVTALRAKHAEDIRKLILKYNPVIVDPVLVAQLNALGAHPAAYPTYEQPSRIASYNLIPAEMQTSLAARVDRARRLLAALRSIPYENSVPPLMNVLDNAMADALLGYEGYLVPLAAHMDYLDGVIGQRDATIAERELTIAQREATIAERDATIVTLLNQIAGLEADLETERAGRVADLEAAEAARLVALEERHAAEAVELADREAERARAAAWLARWTSGVEDFVATFRDQDGVISDAKVTGDFLVVLKTERAKALAAAIVTAANTPAPVAVAGRPAPVVAPVNLATVRDGLNNSELGVVSLEQASDGVWRAKVVKVNDPKKPFKSFDRLVLTLPTKK